MDILCYLEKELEIMKWGMNKTNEEIRILYKELEKGNIELEKRVEERTRELKESQEQLIQSAKFSALGELTAGVAHELNQPLNVIKIVCQSILRDIQKDRFDKKSAEADLPEIVKHVDKMADIIDHMRVFTRRTTGMPKGVINVNNMIEGVFKIFGQQLKDQNIEIIKELNPSLPNVIGDPVRFEQAILNLITNARNAVESFGKENKRIEIRTYSVDGHKAMAVEVKDTGGGIPEHIREKIFEPFFTTGRPGKGTGLGLSVAKKIIEEHNGKIELESTVGEGTVFRIIVPAVEAEEEAE